MRIKFKEDHKEGRYTFKAGEEADVTASLGNKLISIGKAEELVIESISFSGVTIPVKKAASSKVTEKTKK